MFTPYREPFLPARKPYRIGALLTLEAQIAEGFLELRCAIPFLTKEHFETRGLVSKETLVLPRWGSEAQKIF